jgi:hypothetical protein
MVLLRILLALLAYALAIENTNFLERPSWWEKVSWRGLLYAVLAALGLYFCWSAWGKSLAPLPLVHDEMAYLLQARIFAHGALTAPAWPDPEMFRQWHVFGTPNVAAKYFPGHSLVLTPGIWIGSPAFIQYALAAAASVLLFVLVCRLSGPVTGLLTCFLWLSSLDAMRYMASYFSETSAVVIWLLAWIFLQRWQTSNATRWFLAATAAAAFAFVIRPISAVALGLSLVVAVLLHWHRTRPPIRLLLKQVSVAAVIVAMGVAVVMVSNYSLTGSFTKSGFQRYAMEFLPFDHMGFGLHEHAIYSTAEQQAYSTYFEKQHAFHTLAHLPSIAKDRLYLIVIGAWGTFWAFYAFLAIVGLLTASPFARTWALSFFTLFILYLFYAYKSNRTIYFLETLPVLMYLTALGGVRCVKFAYLMISRRFPPLKYTQYVRLLSVILIFICVRAGLTVSLYNSELATRRIRRYHNDYKRVEDSLPAGRKIIFIRYKPKHSPWRSLVENNPYLREEETWHVYDMGNERNSRLLKANRERTGYLFDEEKYVFYRLGPDGSIIAPEVCKAPGGAIVHLN